MILKLRSQVRQERFPVGVAPFSFLAVAVLCGGLVPGSLLAQGSGAPAETGHSFGFEVKSHYRDSDAESFATPFSTAFRLETVDPGDSFEVSTATVFYRGTWGEEGLWSAKAKVDLIDKYNRNPTSEDDEWDLDELWLRFGTEPEPGGVHEGYSGFAKLGKFPKFERQDDRHLESYGLLSTSFNRAEDVGLEMGFDFGRHFYMRFSFTEGNPVFFRDVNALAGDNGTGPPPDGPFSAELKSGIPILYDADVNDVGFDNPEVGLGLGLRFGDAARWNLDVLAFGYRRDLADTVDLRGTFYGGDLDLLLGPGNGFPLVPITSDQKEEFGLNVWLYAGAFTLFGQYVEQDVAGLVRDGYEVEVAYDFALPWVSSAFGRQVLPYVAPAVRYSSMDPDFGLDPLHPFPAPSVFWDWDKLDIGVRLGLIEGLADLTVEYSDNTFVRGGRDESADELLATLRIMWDRFWE